MFTELLLLICTAILLTYLYFQKKWNFFKQHNIPHEPPSFKNLGHAKLMFGENSVKFELECKKKFGNVWGYYLMSQPRIVIHDIEMIKQVMIKDFSNFPNRYHHPSSIGSFELENGVLAAEQKQWKRMRSTLSPSFSNVKIKAMSEIVMWSIRNMMQIFEKRVENGNGIFNPKDAFHSFSLDVVCSTAFSIDVNSQDKSKPQPEISQRAKMFFNNNLIKKIRIFIGVSFPFLAKFMVGKSHRQKQVLYFSQLCQKMISERVNNESKPCGNRPDLMQAMLGSMISKEDIQKGAQKGLTEIEVIGNAISMLLAGYDTTGIAMTYLAYNLATNYKVQEQLQHEIDQAFSGKEELDFDTCSNLKYLDMCVKESLRLYCPVGRTIRTATQTATISGLLLPNGATVSIPIAALCRDPELWTEPMKYDPERMREAQDINPIIFQPFGSGPRNCIGMKFAFMEIKLTFCTILRKYSFKPTRNTPEPPLILKQFITTSPVAEFNLELAPRYKSSQ